MHFFYAGEEYVDKCSLYCSNCRQAHTFKIVCDNFFNKKKPCTRIVCAKCIERQGTGLLEDILGRRGWCCFTCQKSQKSSSNSKEREEKQPIVEDSPSDDSPSEDERILEERPERKMYTIVKRSDAEAQFRVQQTLGLLHRMLIAVAKKDMNMVKPALKNHVVDTFGRPMFTEPVSNFEFISPNVYDKFSSAIKIKEE